MEEISETIFEDFQAEPKAEENWHTNPRYEQLRKNLHYLHLDPCEAETLGKFKEIVMTRRRVEDHDALMRFLKADEIINDKLAELSLNCLETKAMTNAYHMIKVVRMVGGKWGFGLLEESPGEFAKLDEGLYKLVKHVLKIIRANPENQQEAGKLYETMVNKVTYRNFVKCTKGGLSWNTEDVKTHLAPASLKIPGLWDSTPWSLASLV